MDMWLNQNKNTAQHSTTQHNTPQHNATQHNKKLNQHNAIQLNETQQGGFGPFWFVLFCLVRTDAQSNKQMAHRLVPSDCVYFVLFDYNLITAITTPTFSRNFARPFAPQTWLRSASNFAKMHFDDSWHFIFQRQQTNWRTL